MYQDTKPVVYYIPYVQHASPHEITVSQKPVVRFSEWRKLMSAFTEKRINAIRMIPQT